MITYLDSTRVEDKRQTKRPIVCSRSGYGRKIPTTWQIKVGRVWRRVYVVCYSNAGSAYVLIKGEAHFLGSYDPGSP